MNENDESPSDLKIANLFNKIGVNTWLILSIIFSVTIVSVSLLSAFKELSTDDCDTTIETMGGKTTTTTTCN
jgi:hypothetical protein